ncbi:MULTISPECIES: DegT/DnrJ/EryC1/StrS aminotransferase family protein [Leptospira]|uniref:DegT/DnrJ/EryC1/StrS family aminotransferase n=1 Tax=Leptospira TaxID=171 RepID=UPI0002BFD522|nr:MULTISPECIES: DegT/DnrJ/EryC1/StrS family aminotransferase [Leptospira]EMJ63848.1 putative spore coat polysaccharide biosynthesis protein SpsC [Leptospira sp. P2653]
MPGFELIGNEEFGELEDLFQRSKILFRHGFDGIRNGVFKVREFELAFAKHFGFRDALAVTSGTAALKVAMKAANIKPGDEVITQSFTFLATVEAIVEAGATPIICEIDESLNMDPIALEKLITQKTKMIVPVHMLGVPARMDQILAIARKHNLLVMEDTAWGCGGKFQGSYLGTLGDIGSFSFDFAKIITTGEGGMILAKDQSLLERAKAYHDHGHENNPKLPRWEDSRSSSGFNYRMTEMQGAVGLAQLKKLGEIVKLQRANLEKIKSVVSQYEGIRFRDVPESGEETADALVFFTKTPKLARAFRSAMLEEGLGTKILPEAISWHFAGTWNHIPELVCQYSNLFEAFPRSLELLDRSVAIPIQVKMQDQVLDKVNSAMIKVFKGN